MKVLSQDEKVDELWSRHAIHDATLRCARGFDRCDNDLIASAFHPGAQIDYGGAFKVSAEEMVLWADKFHRSLLGSCHFKLNQLIEFDQNNPDVAYGETYVQGGLRMDDQDVTGVARYVDRFERRNGDWRITERISILDFAMTRQREGRSENAAGQTWLSGSRSLEDPSYKIFMRGRAPK